mmetsp:Transcript_25786/g.60456  ORF Transcript_25786/g.60456 Transcript_25786/m.60456 type:complete len:429 (+) Transcript_25786:199-1485(+)|eukprot:CAMPEP_0197190184 /NCGR_PEP_ID=MMETSP1423-20130617/21131_1 /TAXON_ID=476441 /ORGANISM="Pseudo-nitzschia heimii, Strain UNC1101" /LENGTH=428 /DNA_ID=CAMNT_0042642507 /DNA_START=156 /DNA_END=1442 /DNA_ORIENTATION=-
MKYCEDITTFLFLNILLVCYQYCFVAASHEVVGWRTSFGRDKKSYIFGILGKAFGSSQTDKNKYRNSSFLRSSACTSFDYLSNSHGSSELNCDNWTKERESIDIKNIKQSTKDIYRDALRKKHILFRKATERKTSAQKSNDSSPYFCNRRGTHDGGYDSCIVASLTATEQKADVIAMTSPIVPLTISLDDQKGEEFGNSEAMDQFVSSGLEVATKDENDWIEWKMHSSTKKLFEENNNEMALLEQGEVLVYIGKCKQEGHGSKLPIIRTKSILPLSAEEMAELLMDSSRVKIYNKMSVGRTDLRSLGDETKVVCNLTKPPMTKSNMVSCTMMHSRKLEEQQPGSDSSYLVVSRATPGMTDETMSDLPRNDILLGVNVLEGRGPNECVMTAVTHVYSPSLPTILAKKVGVSSAVNFIKDIRQSCSTVGS